MTNLLELKGVGKQFPGFSLDKLTFSLPKGFIMGLVGPNGSGKTTTIQLILNMLERDSGEIKVFGLDNQEYTNRIKQKVGVVFDSSIFVDAWTINDAEKAIAPFYQTWNSEIFQKLIGYFGLPRKKQVGTLSRGMQMKLMLACALSHDAKLLILDEPTSGLDVVTRDQLTEILQDFIKDGERSVLFSTHISNDLERIADYVTFINDGQLFYTGSLEGLKEKYCLIKGAPGGLTKDLESKILGLRKTNLGFEGLLAVADSTNLDNIVLDEAKLDDIVLFASKKGVTIEWQS